MKTSKWMVLMVMAGIVLAGGSALAGNLTPPNAPGSTMHTLEEIYQELLTTKQNVLTPSSRSPTCSMS